MSATRRCSLTGMRARAFSISERTPSSFRHGFCQNVGSIEDAVAVALFGQEHLAMMCEIQLPSVARHKRVKMGHFAVCLGPQDTPQALRFLLARAERA